MLGGPICQFELVRIARRRATYTLRFVFGLVLLGILGLNYEGIAGPVSQWDSRVWTLREIARLGQGLFWSIVSAQTLIVLFLTPVLVADAIASERQRKTLTYLLASPLESLSIVGGKLAARLLGVGVYPVMVLPVMSLLTLIGGVSPAGLLLSYVALASSAFFLAALALLASVLARRPRDAVSAAYVAGAAWLAAPGVVPMVLSSLPTSLLPLTQLLANVFFWIWPASPLALATNAGALLGGAPNELARLTLRLVGSHAVYGTLFLALAAWQLRPAFRRHEGRVGRPVRIRRMPWRRAPVPPCGDDPVYWKEAYFAPVAGGLRQQSTVFGVKLVLALIVLGVLLLGSPEAFLELLRHGYGFGDSNSYDARFRLNLLLRALSAGLFAVWALWLGSTTAVGIASEREEDTWLSLVSTPLEGREILRAKMLGPIRASAHFGHALAALWGIGLLAGAVHPLGAVAAAVVLTLYTWFAVSLGSYLSLHAKLAWHARARTLGILAVSNFCCMVPVSGGLMTMAFSLTSYMEWSELLFGSSRRDLLPLLVFLIGPVIHALAALALTSAAFTDIDRVIDRPSRLPGQYRRPPSG